MQESVRMMVVQRPAAVADRVREPAAVHDVVLVEQMVADKAAAFAFARQGPDPVELEIAAASVGMVFHISPDAVGDPFQFPRDVTGVSQRVEIAAIFDPPEIVVLRIRV